MRQSGMVLAASVALLAAPTLGHEAGQTDWSGGGGVPGPVTDWDDVFEYSTDVHWGWNDGELRLTPDPTGHEVAELFMSASCVHATDMDGDGDLDVLAAGYYQDEVAWFEYAGSPDSTWTKHVIASLNGARSVDPGDLDGDGDVDVAAASPVEDLIMVYVNDGGASSWSAVEVDWMDGKEATSVDFADVDGDGDADLLGSWEFEDALFWYENEGGTTFSVTRHTIDADFNAPYCILGVDMDDDGDVDVLSTSYYGTHPDFLDHYAWWSNDDGSGGSWTKHVIDGCADYDGAASACAADIDGDGDMDVVGHTDWMQDDTHVLWFENDGTGDSFETRVIDSTFVGASGDRSIICGDLDMDGDVDVVAGSHLSGRQLAWWSNSSGDGERWHKHVIEQGFGAYGIDMTDLDGDGSPEVLAGSWSSGYPYDGAIAWWEMSYDEEGELRSSVLDTEMAPGWGTLEWTADLPPGARVSVEVRASDQHSQMGDWTEVAASGEDISQYVPDGLRYFQYRLLLSTVDPDVTPVFGELSLQWDEQSGSGGGARSPGLTVGPVPAGAEVWLRLSTAAAGPVSVAVYDTSGRLVDRMDPGVLQAGEHVMSWSPGGTGSSIFLLLVRSQAGTETRKLVFLR